MKKRKPVSASVPDTERATISVSPDGEMRMVISSIEIQRFWSKVTRTDGCWEWQASRKGSLGYGAFCLSRHSAAAGGIGRSQLAHRVSYYLSHGPILDGMQVLHRCDNPLCVRPDHLFLGTQADNIQDCVEKNRAVNGNLKLTASQVAEIRQFAGTTTLTALGQRYGVHRRQIKRIIEGECWNDNNG